MNNNPIKIKISYVGLYLKDQCHKCNKWTDIKIYKQDYKLSERIKLMGICSLCANKTVVTRRDYVYAIPLSNEAGFMLDMQL